MNVKTTVDSISRGVLGAAALALALTAAPALAAEAAWDEAEAVARFQVEAPQMMAVRRQVEVARADVAMAAAFKNPTLDLGREQVFSPGGPAEEHRLGVAGTLPVFGQRGLRVAIAEAGAAAATARAEGALSALTRAFRATFARAHLADRRVEALAATLATFRRLERVAEARRRAGESAGYDVLRLQLARTAAEGQLEDAKARARAARGELAGLLGRPVATALRLAPPRPVPTEPDLFRALEARHPDLRLLRAEQARVRAEGDLAAHARWVEPQLAVGMKQTNEPTVQGFGYTAGLSWPVPLLDQGHGAIARARADLARLEAEERALTARLRAELPPARQALVDRRAQLARFEAEVRPRVPRVLKIAQIAYQEGDQGVASLLDAHQAARDAALQGLDLQAAAHDAQLDLERIAGLPPAAPPESLP